MYKVLASLDLLHNIDNSFNISCHAVDKVENCNKLIGNRTLKVLNMNIRSVNHNFNAFMTFLARLDTQFDAIVLTECWISNASVIPHIPGYISSNSNKFINKAGGVVIYIKSNWSPNFSEPPLVDANCVLAEIPGVFSILGVYRSPSFLDKTPYLISLETEISKLAHNNRLLIAGDINIEIISEDANHNYMCLMSRLGYIPAITKPTRDNACLDHIFIPNKTTATSIVCHTALTDHRPTMVGLSFDYSEKSNHQSRYRTKINFDGLLSDISQIDWSDTLQSLCPSKAAESLESKIGAAIKDNSQIVKLSHSQFTIQPWMTPGLLRCAKHKDRLHAEVRKYPDNLLKKQIYTRYHNFYNNLIRKLKRQHDSKLLQDNKRNPKKLWECIRKVTHTQRSKTASLELTRIKDSSSASLDYCNEYFSSVGKSLATKILNDINSTEESLAAKINVDNGPTNSFFLTPTDPCEVESRINNLKNDSAPGIDGITGRILKIIGKFISVPLAHIFNLSFQTGEFPEIWKTAIVIPIHKSGPKNDPKNYRPISLLVIFSKLLEGLVNDRLMNFLESHELLSNQQFGFRKNRSTEKAVSLLTDTIVSHLDSGRPCTGVFLDFSRAFDTVSISILVRRLEQMGVRGTALRWFSSYLNGRRQCVKVDSNVSGIQSVSFGVPQGSILGPTLFLVYINSLASLDLPQASIICYADDTAILFTGSNWKDCFENVSNGLATISNWLKNNVLTLNAQKSKLLCFHKTAASAPVDIPEVTIHSCNSLPGSGNLNCACGSIERSCSVRYLGVILDEKLSFASHIDITCKRLRKIIHIMKLLRESANRRLLTTVYLALCESILTYCISIWGGASSCYMINIERTQRAILKTLFRKPTLYPTVSLYNDANVLSVRKLYILKIALDTHRHVIQAPDYPQLLKKRVFKIHAPLVNTTFARRFTQFASPFIYNKICKICNIKENSVAKAKSLIFSLILPWNYDYTEEFLRILK